MNRIIYLARSFSWLVDPRLLGRVRDYPIDRPIFLLGTQGGGLTLLSRMLRRHTDVIGAAGNSSYWTGADEVQNVYGLVLPPELTGLRYKAPPHPVLRAPRSWTYASRDLFSIYRKTDRDWTPELDAALKRVIRWSARRHARDPYRFRFVDKSQVFTLRVGLIQSILKESNPRFVLVLREPYIAVYRAATGGAADMRRLSSVLPFTDRVDICAEHYANSVRAALEDADGLGLELYILRFEELLANPEGYLREVCKFTGLTATADMIPGPSHRLPLGSRHRDRWYPLRGDVNSQYEPMIDHTVISAVNRHFGDELEIMGYQRRPS